VAKNTEPFKYQLQEIFNKIFDPDAATIATNNEGASSGSTPTPTTVADEKIIEASDATYEYFAFAPAGSSAASEVWKVIRIDSNGNKWHADGDTNYNNTATNIAALTYS
jgi:hypothetical protein